MLSNRFSKKYRKLLLLRHFIGAFIVFFVLLAVCLGIESVGNNNFYIFIEKVAGYDFACFVHDYEPSIIVFGFLILELFMWIAYAYRNGVCRFSFPVRIYGQRENHRGHYRHSTG